MKDMSRKIPIIKMSIIIIVVTLIFFMLELLFIKDYNTNVNSYDNEIIDYYEEQYNTITYSYRMLAEMYYDEIINKENILNIIEEANNADDDRKKILRSKLNDALRKTYVKAVENNFRQFHFVLKDSTSFLRMHKVENFGDNLREIRYTVKIANEEQRYIEGFEEGRIFNGYRYEFPLLKDENHIGCVETSISFVSVIKLMDKLFGNPSFFMIKKNIVDSKVYPEEIVKSYSESNISNDYYCDNEVLNYIREQEEYINLIDKLTKNYKLNEKNETSLKQGDTFSLDIDYNDRIYTVVFLKIDNVEEKHVGYLVLYNENLVFESFKKNLVVKTTFLMALWIITLVTIFIIDRSKTKMDMLIYFDKLTGAYNRNKLFEYIKKEIERKERYDIDFSIIIYDIDKFKRVNDSYGHLIGDAVLKETTKIVENNIRVNDYLFRFGGDEFIILLPNTKLEGAKVLAEKIRVTIQNQEKFSKVVTNVTFSLGAAQYKNSEISQEFIKRADTMLYKAKELGRNKIFG